MIDLKNDDEKRVEAWYIAFSAALAGTSGIASMQQAGVIAACAANIADAALEEIKKRGG